METVERLSVEELQPRQMRQAKSQPVIPETVSVSPPVSAPNTLEVILAAFTGLGYALSARALLLLSLIGSFVLGMRAMDAQSLPALEVLIAYSLLTVIPASILEIRKRA